MRPVACLAAARLVAGLGFVAAPRRLGGLLVGDDANSPGAQLFIAAFGMRDVLLGSGVLRAIASGAGVRPWLLSCATADAFDAVATLRAFEHLPRGRRALAFGVSIAPAIAGAWLAARPAPPAPSAPARAVPAASA